MISESPQGGSRYIEAPTSHSKAPSDPVQLSHAFSNYTNQSSHGSELETLAYATFWEQMREEVLSR